MLALMSMITGLAASVLFLVAASKQPAKARQLRINGALFFGIAVIMAVMLF